MIKGNEPLWYWVLYNPLLAEIAQVNQSHPSIPGIQTIRVHQTAPSLDSNYAGRTAALVPGIPT